jgi:hypothetical protein
MSVGVGYRLPDERIYRIFAVWQRPMRASTVENAVEVEPVGEFELKGIRRPLAAYNVIGVGTSTV